MVLALWLGHSNCSSNGTVHMSATTAQSSSGLTRSAGRRSGLVARSPDWHLMASRRSQRHSKGQTAQPNHGLQCSQKGDCTGCHARLARRNAEWCACSRQLAWYVAVWQPCCRPQRRPSGTAESLSGWLACVGRHPLHHGRWWSWLEAVDRASKQKLLWLSWEPPSFSSQQSLGL